MKILKLQNRRFIYLVYLFVLFINNILFANEPIDIWDIQIKKADETVKDKEAKTKNFYQKETDTENNIIIGQKLETTNIKLAGLYDPQSNGLKIDMWSNSDGEPIIPREFIQQFRRECIETNKEFYNFHQNDTEEFIEFFMDLLHRSMKRRVQFTFKGEVKTQLDKLAIQSSKSWSQFFKDDYSYIVEKFYSQLLSLTSCTNCDYVTATFDPATGSQF